MEVHTAVVDDDVTTLARLHANSVPLDKKDEDERTPLHWASAHGRIDVVEFLLQTAKARVNVQDDAGWTPLMSAASAGHVDVVSLLLSQYVFASAEHKSSAQDGANANLANENGQIPLHYHRGRLEIAELLVDCTTDINCAVRHCLAIRLVLLTFEFNLFYCIGFGKQDDVGSTPLTRAIGGKPSREIIALFLDHGARLTTRDIGGNTPLHIALAEGHEDIARFLIEAGANVNAKNKGNECCVDLMTSAFRKEIASVLPGKFEASNP